MARITVEDCLSCVDNRFELVLIAARRARELALGREPLVPWENDKPTVVALRELAEGKLDHLLQEKYRGRGLASRDASSSLDHDDASIASA